MQIGFQNFNGLTGKADNLVDRSLRDWVMDNSFDIFGIPEVNMYWPKVRKDLQFNKRINQMWQPGQCRSLHAYNRTEKGTNDLYDNMAVRHNSVLDLRLPVNSIEEKTFEDLGVGCGRNIEEKTTVNFE